MLDSIELRKIHLVVRSDVDVGSLVAGCIAVVWCRED